jgi:hypothetical protein
MLMQRTCLHQLLEDLFVERVVDPHDTTIKFVVVVTGPPLACVSAVIVLPSLGWIKPVLGLKLIRNSLFGSSSSTVCSASRQSVRCRFHGIFVWWRFGHVSPCPPVGRGGSSRRSDLTTVSSRSGGLESKK